MKNGHQLGLVGRLPVVFGFEGKDTKVLKTTESPYVADLAAIYVRCNIVQPQIAGDTNTQSLESIQFKGAFGETIAKPFTNIQYVHIQTKSFEDVEILLKSDTAGIVPCRYFKERYRRGCAK